MNLFHWRSLKTRLTLFTLLIFLLSLWSLAFYASRMLRQDMEQLLGEQQLSTAAFFASGLDEQLNSRLDALEKVSAGISPAMLDDPASVHALLDQRPLLRNVFDGGILVTRLDGSVVGAAPLAAAGMSVNYIDADYVATVHNRGKSFIGRPVTGTGLPRPVLPMAAPIRDAQGKVVGALVGLTDLSKANFLDKIAGNAYGNSGGYLLVEPRHRLIITATDKSRLMEALPAPGALPQIDRFLQSPEGSRVLVNPHGVEQLTSAKTLATTGWLAVVALPTAEAFAPIRAMQQRMLMATVLLSLLAGGLTWWLLRHELSALSSTVGMLTRLSDGDEPPKSLPVASDNEIGALIGSFNHLLGILEQRERALRASEARLRLLLDATAEAVYGIDVDGRCTFCNPACVALLGYRHADELIGKTMHELIHHTRPDGTAYPISECQFVDAARKGEALHSSDEIFWRADGSSLPVECWTHPQLDHGELVGAVVTFMDISERVRAQARLIKLSKVVENSPASVVITDIDGTIDYVNRRFVEMTGYAEAEVLGQRRDLLRSDNQPLEAYEAMRQTITSGLVWQGELLNRKKNGQTYLAQLTISPVRDERGSVAYFVWIGQDITRQRQSEVELKQAKESAELANRAKGDFLANMSHEIRTPMNAIIGFSELCLRTELDAKQRNYLDNISQAARELLGIIDDILDLSRIEAGKLSMERIAFDLEAVLDQVTALNSTQARDKGIELIIETAPGVPTHLLGDPLRLRQVLINLVDNALKFTEHGMVQLSVELAQAAENEVLLRFTVRDTGIGLSAEQIARLFQPFMQADSSITRKFGGTGLGLSISHRLVAMMGGEFEVESTPGQGSRFSFSARLQTYQPPAGEKPPPASGQAISPAAVDKVDAPSAPAADINAAQPDPDPPDLLQVLLDRAERQLELFDASIRDTMRELLQIAPLPSTLSQTLNDVVQLVMVYDYETALNRLRIGKAGNAALSAQGD